MTSTEQYLGMWNGWSRSHYGSPAYDPWLDEYRDDLDKRKGGTFIDLGCGTGANTLYLRERGFDVLSCDYSEEAMRNVRDNIPGSRTEYVNMEKPLPFGDQSFSVAVGDISLHYFDDAATRQLMHEIRRILVPGGILLARVSSTKDMHGTYRQIEPGYYDLGGWAQRFFPEEEVREYFGIIGELAYRETSMTRAEAFYSSPKMLWEIRAERI